MSRASHRITLLTDFGTADGYAAAMKGVIAQINPLARVDDAAHDIPAGDVIAAAWALGAYWELYPPGTVHVVVVDPGVGSQRRAVAARAGDRLFVAPDNGVLTAVFREAAAAECVELTNRSLQRSTVSATFHGRDIFAPAAAYLSAGVALGEFGARMTDPVVLVEPDAVETAEGLEGLVVHVDRFGNLVTNLPAAWVGTGTRVRIEGHVLAVLDCYAAAQPLELLAIAGSRGMIEVSQRAGSAAAALAAARGTRVVLQRG